MGKIGAKVVGGVKAHDNQNNDINSDPNTDQEGVRKYSTNARRINDRERDPMREGARKRENGWESERERESSKKGEGRVRKRVGKGDRKRRKDSEGANGSQERENERGKNFERFTRRKRERGGERERHGVIKGASEVRKRESKGETERGRNSEEEREKHGGTGEDEERNGRRLRPTDMERNHGQTARIGAETPGEIKDHIAAHNAHTEAGPAPHPLIAGVAKTRGNRSNDVNAELNAGQECMHKHGRNARRTSERERDSEREGMRERGGESERESERERKNNGAREEIGSERVGRNDRESRRQSDRENGRQERESGGGVNEVRKRVGQSERERGRDNDELGAKDGGASEEEERNGGRLRVACTTHSRWQTAKIGIKVVGGARARMTAQDVDTESGPAPHPHGQSQYAITLVPGSNSVGMEQKRGRLGVSEREKGRVNIREGGVSEREREGEGGKNHYEREEPAEERPPDTTHKYQPNIATKTRTVGRAKTQANTYNIDTGTNTALHHLDWKRDGDKCESTIYVKNDSESERVREKSKIGGWENEEGRDEYIERMGKEKERASNRERGRRGGEEREREKERGSEWLSYGEGSKEELIVKMESGQVQNNKINSPHLVSGQDESNNKDNKVSKDRKKCKKRISNNAGLKIDKPMDWSGPMTRARSRAQRTTCINTSSH